MNKTSSFGKIVKERRSQLDLTQAELAHRVGCATITIRKIEADALRPSVQISERLAMSLKIPLVDRVDFVRLARTATLKDPTPPPLPTPPLQPSEIGLDDLSGRAVRSYELAERIGEGGFGAVYRAMQSQIEREVAIKIILPKYANNPQFIRRFEAEAKTVARLEHPHIVPLYDFWREPGVAYLVMRLMRGHSLYDAMQNGPLAANDAIHTLDQIGSALHAAHRMGVIHRDIKPANILLDDDRNAYLSDFGIAKNMNMEGHTQAGQLIGSPAYLSPEQILAEPIRPQTDIYCLGVLLFEMLTAHKPFDGPTPVAYLQQHLHDSLPPLAKYNSELPEMLDGVIAKATAKSPADRYEDVVQMITAVNEAIGTSVHLSAGNGSADSRSPAINLATQDWAELENPYKGLHAFTEADVDRFFGRETLIQELIAQLTQTNELTRFLAVVGPSGSGKSSVVKAGLVPALRRGGLPNSENWFVVDFTPGSHPWEEVEAALLRVAVNPPESLLGQLQESSRGLTRAINRILPDDGESELVMVIDQFEELFTLVEDETVREQFLDSLVQAILDERSRLRLILTLRADFYDRPLQYVDFGDLLRQQTISVLPMTPDELEQAITKPVAQLGVSLEAGLLPNIMQDVAEQPGGLPLLQYALMELFERRERHLMTTTAYQEIGGVTGALARRADEIYDRLDENGRLATRQLFLRLITLGEGNEDTRRRVRLSELEAVQQTSEVLETSEVLNEYGRHRLLTFDYDPLTREPTVEVAHEALLREWIRLRDWLDDSRSDIRLQRLLADAATQWANSNQDASYLLHGSRLDNFMSWETDTAVALTHQEQDYLHASIAARTQRQMEEESRRKREVETAQQLAETERQRAEEQTHSAHTLQKRAVSLGVALIVAVILAIAAILASIQANNNAETAVANANIAATREVEAKIERQTAEEQAIISFSRELAAAALSNLGSDPELGVLLALEALSIRNTLAAESALHQAIVASPLRQTFFNESTGSVWLAASPNGQTIFVSGAGGGTAWDTTTGHVLYTHPVPGEDWINRADFSPDDSLLVLPGESFDANGGDLPGEVTIIDAKTGQELVRFVAHRLWLQAAKFSPDGTLFATTSGDLTVKVWDLEATLEAGTGQLVATFCCTDDWNNGLDFSHESEHLAINMGEGELIIWDITSDDTLFTLGPEIRYEANYSPDGLYLVTAGNIGNIDIWDAATGERLSRTIGHSGNALSHVQFNHAGSQIVSTSNDGSVSLWRFSPFGLEEMQKIPNHAGNVGGAAFSPDDKFLYTSSDAGTTRVWDVSASGSAELAAIKAHDDIRTSDFHLIANGSQLVTVGYDGMLRLWDAQIWEEIRGFQAHNGRISEIDVSPDGQMIATVSVDDVTPKIWDATTWQQLFTLEGHKLQEQGFNRGVFAVHFSPDGQRLATGGADRTVRIWDVDGGELLLTLVGHDGWVIRIDYSTDGRLLATASNDGTIRVWDAHNGQMLLTTGNAPASSGYWGLAFSPVGSRLAAGGSSQEIEVWQLPADPWQATDEDMVKLFQLQSGSGWVDQMNFSPDGERIAIPGLAGLVEIRDAETGEFLLGLQHPAAVAKAEFTSDGKHLMTSGWDGIFRIWALDLAELTTLAQSRITRSLTEAECQQYLHLDSCPVE